jgi:predicted small lipoprotein YifL
MKARTFRWLFLIAGLTAIAGCARKQPAAREISPPPAPTQASISHDEIGVPPEKAGALSSEPGLGPPDAKEVSPPRAQAFIFYDPAGAPSLLTPALSESELREITAWVAARTPRPIWFIRVTASLELGKRGYMRAYLAPDESTPRIRVGGALTVFEGATPAEYVQVSLVDQPFTDQLAKPSALDLPFTGKAVVVIERDSGKTSPMSREEIVGIVDFVRDPSNYKNTSLGRRPELPILSIRREGGKIDVTLGYVNGPLDGGGETVTLEQTPTGYKVKTGGMWIS